MNRGVISSFLSFIYSSLVAIRNFFYETKILSTKSLNCKVISIGNITVGGSGKTPTVEYLSNLLQSKGHNVGIISRGYKRKSKSTLVVTDGKKKPKSWEHVGDEPYLLAHKLENIPIVVGVSRYKAGSMMIEKFQPDVILIDDGFQHLSLHRDLDIVLVNSKDKRSDYKLIPSGKLREPISNLIRADLIVITKTNIHQPSNYLINKIESFNRPTIYNEIQIDDLLQYKSNKSNKLEKIANKKVYLFSALGDNESFKKIMDNTDAEIVGHSKYQDHHHYTFDNLKDIEQEARKSAVVNQPDSLEEAVYRRLFESAAEDIDLRDFAGNVARLVKNYQNLIDWESVILNKAQSFINNHYGEATARVLFDILEDEYGIVKKVKEEEPAEAPIAVGARGEGGG